jgi:activating signal cointegrator complex subunit 2
MVSLFPYISSDLLSQALNHPTYAGSPQPLVEAILAGGFNLPSELRELRALVMDHSGLGDQAEGSGTNANGNSNVKKSERRNIWQDEKIDFSRLKIKDHSYVHHTLASLV